MNDSPTTKPKLRQAVTSMLHVATIGFGLPRGHQSYEVRLKTTGSDTGLLRYDKSKLRRGSRPYHAACAARRHYIEEITNRLAELLGIT